MTLDNHYRVDFTHEIRQVTQPAQNVLYFEEPPTPQRCRNWIGGTAGIGDNIQIISITPMPPEEVKKWLQE